MAAGSIPAPPGAPPGITPPPAAPAPAPPLAAPVAPAPANVSPPPPLVPQSQPTVSSNADFVPVGPDVPIATFQAQQSPQPASAAPAQPIGSQWQPTAPDEPLSVYQAGERQQPALKAPLPAPDNRGIYDRTRDFLVGHAPTPGSTDQTWEAGVLPALKTAFGPVADKFSGGPSYETLAKAYVHAAPAGPKMLEAGYQEIYGENKAASAERLIQGLTLLPSAAARTPGHGTSPNDIRAMAQDPQVRIAARNLGIAPLDFASDWLNRQYALMNPGMRADQIKAAETSLAYGRSVQKAGRANREKASAIDQVWGTPSDLAGGQLRSGSLKGVLWNTALMVPTMIAATGATLAATAVGGPAAGTATGVASYLALTVPAQREQAKQTVNTHADALQSQAARIEADNGQRMTPQSIALRNQASDLLKHSSEIANNAAFYYGLADAAGSIPLESVVARTPLAKSILDKVLGRFVEKGLGTRIASTAIANGAGVMLQSALQKGVDAKVLNVKQPLSQAIRDIGYSGLIGAIGGAPFGLLPHGETAQTGPSVDELMASFRDPNRATGDRYNPFEPGSADWLRTETYYNQREQLGKRYLGYDQTEAPQTSQGGTPTQPAAGEAAPLEPKPKPAAPAAGAAAARTEHEAKVDAVKAAASARAESRGDITLEPEEKGWSVRVKGEPVAYFNSRSNGQAALAAGRSAIGTAAGATTAAAAPQTPAAATTQGETPVAAPSPAEEPGQPISADRRRNAAERERLAAMSPDEFHQSVYVSPHTGISNKRSYQEAQKKAVQGAIDVDSLKWVNDNLGHAAGDQMLTLVARALNNATNGEAWHISGDEFVTQGETPEEINAAVARARTELKGVKLQLARPDGRTVTMDGVDFSHGTGANLHEADLDLQRAKAEREASGLRAGRGEQPPGASITAPEAGIPADQDLGAARAATGAEPAKPARAPRTVEVLGQKVELPARPTPAQAEAGNYSKPTVYFHGLPIRLEHVAGQSREGIDANGVPFKSKMHVPYGYFGNTKAADGDHFDAFVGPHQDAKSVFVIDQLKPDGKTYDEGKAVVGASSEAEARKIYLKHYPKGWRGLGAITELPIDEFKAFVGSPRARLPLRYQPPEEKIQRKEAPDARHDSILQWLARHPRGLSTEEAEAQGIDKADMGARQAFHGIKRAFRKNGLGFDQAAESLAEDGYPVVDERGAYSPNVLLDRLSDELRGRPHYSSHNIRAMEMEAAERAHQEWLEPMSSDEIAKMPQTDQALRRELLERIQAEVHAEIEARAKQATRETEDEAEARAEREAIQRESEESEERERTDHLAAASADDDIPFSRPPDFELTAPGGKLGKAPERTGKPEEPASTRRFRVQGDLFDQQVAIANELAKMAAAKDRARNTGQISPEVGNADDLFSDARKQADLTAPETKDVRELIRDSLVRFASGMSRLKDLAAGTWATSGSHKLGVGVDVGELTDAGIAEIAHAVAEWGNQVFVDSGAFSLFRRKLMGEDDAKPLDFDKILERYDKIMEAIAERDEAEEGRGRLMMVMPDIVGDQAASLALVAKYKNWINAHILPHDESRFVPIIPIQKGELTLAEAWQDVVRELGHSHFVVGVPSNEKAVTDAEFAAFLRDAPFDDPRAPNKRVAPRWIHLLGASSDAVLARKIDAIARSEILDPRLSADSNILRSSLYGRDVEPGESRSEAIKRTLQTEADRAEPPSDEDLQDREHDAVRRARRGIDDVGQKIGGARKDVWAERGLRLSDLEGMSETEAAKLVTKQEVWKPKWDAIASSWGQKYAATLKVIYDQIGSKPRDNTPEGRRNYVRALGKLAELVDNLHTHEELTGAGGLSDRLFAALGGGERRHGWNREPPGKALVQIFRGRKDPLYLDYAGRIRVAKLVESGWPTANEPWMRRFKVGKVEPYLENPDYLKSIVKIANDLGTPLTEAEVRAGYWRVDKTGSRSPLALLPTQAAAREAATAFYQKSLEGKPDELLPERPHLDRVERTGPAVRTGNARAEDFLRDFGFRGVEFGNWAADDERQKLVNLGYDAVQDLARVFGIPPRAISLNGTLGLAFGARGKGRAAAHYEPDKLVINMTKVNGAGSLAHEWGHALDHYLGEFERPDAYTTDARGVTGWYRAPTQRTFAHLRPELQEAWRDLMERMFQRARTQAEFVRDLELRIEREKKTLQRETARLEKARTTFAANDKVWVSKMERYLEQQRSLVASLTARLEGARSEPVKPGSYGKVATDFYTEANKLSGSGDYWKRPTELWARAFESYVFDKLKGTGAASDYLVHGVEGERYASGGKGNPYPAGTDRAEINAAIERVAQAIQVRPQGDNEVMFSRPIREDDERSPAEFRVEEPRAAKRASRQVELFTPENEQAVARVTPVPLISAEGKRIVPGAGVRVRLERIGSFRTGVTTIRSPEDAAHLLAPQRRQAQEVMGALVLDPDDRAIAVLRHQIGDATGAGVAHPLLIGAIAQIDGAHAVYFVHNHPSGTTKVSDPDKMATLRLSDLARSIGIEPRGMIIVAGGNGRFAHYLSGDYPGGEMESYPSIKPAARAFDVPNVERVLRRTLPQSVQGKVPLGEIGSGGPTLRPPEAVHAIQRILDGGTRSGIALFSNQRVLVGVLPMSNAELSNPMTGNPRSGSGKVAAAVSETNAIEAIPFGESSAVGYTARWLDRLGVKVIDTFDVPAKGSAASRILAGKDVLYRRNPLRGYAAPAPGHAMNVPDVSAIATEIASQWAVRPDAIVVSPDLDTLKLNPEVGAALADEKSGDVVAFYFGKKIYLVADQIATPEHVAALMAHEGVVHFGLRSVLGSRMNLEYRAIIEGVIRSMPSDFLARGRREFGPDFDETDFRQRMHAGEETLAYWEERYARGQTVARKVVNWILRFYTLLRDHLRAAFGLPQKYDALFVRRVAADLRHYLYTGRWRGNYPLEPEPESEPRAAEGEPVPARAHDLGSPEFKRWFKDSVVVNPDGTPKRVFHSTAHVFNGFRRRRDDIGVHVGTAEQAAERFRSKLEWDENRDRPMNTIPVYVSMQNPLRLDDLGDWSHWNVLAAIREAGDVFSPEEGLAIRDAMSAIRQSGRSAAVTDRASSNLLIERLLAKGFDGIIYKNAFELKGLQEAMNRLSAANALYRARLKVDNISHADAATSDLPELAEYLSAQIALETLKREGAENSYAVLRPGQIKSAIGNEGTWNPRLADLYRSVQEPFYSALSRALDAAKRERGTGAEWEATLRNTGGVRQDELDWYDLKGFLAGRGRVSKAQIARYLHAHDPRFTIHSAGGTEDGPQQEEYAQAHAELLERSRKLGYEPFFDKEGAADGLVLYFDGTTPEHYGTLNGKLQAREYRVDEVPEQLQQAVEHYHSTIPDEFEDSGETYYDEHRLPGGMPIHYQEHLVTFEPNAAARIANVQREMRATQSAVIQESRSIDEDAKATREADLSDDERGRRKAQQVQRIQAVIEMNGRLQALKEALHNEQADAGEGFQSGHWDKPNVVLHLRTSRHRSAAGELVHVIEEVQSDLHQGTRQVAKPALAAPFRRGWPMLGFKIALRQAAERNLPYVGWTTGEQQVNRYNLARQVRDLSLWRHYHRLPSGDLVQDPGRLGDLRGAGEDQHRTIEVAVRDDAHLRELIGKELADRLLAKEPIITGNREQTRESHLRKLEGVDLRMGGEGMRAFYDRILPNEVNAYLKRLGGKVEPLEIGGIGPEKNIAMPALNRGGETNKVMLRSSDGRWSGAPRELTYQGMFDAIREAARENERNGVLPRFSIAPSMRAANDLSNTWRLIRHSGVPRSVENFESQKLRPEQALDLLAALTYEEGAARDNEADGTRPGGVIHAVRITPRMRETALAGQPLFSRPDRVPALHSAVQRAVKASQRERGTGAEWERELANVPGVKREELDWYKIAQELPGKVNKQELSDWLAKADPDVRRQVRDVTHENIPVLRRRARDEANQSIEPYGYVLGAAGSSSAYERLDDLRAPPGEPRGWVISTSGSELSPGRLEHYLRPEAVQPVIKALERFTDEIQDLNRRQTTYSKFALEGGENYREALFTHRPRAIARSADQRGISLSALGLPENPSEDEVRALQSNLRVENEGLGPLGVHYASIAANAEVPFEDRERARAEYTQTRERVIRNENVIAHLRDLLADPGGQFGPYMPPHFGLSNMFAHERMTDHLDEHGNPVLNIEEMQSDLHQAGRRGGSPADISHSKRAPLARGWPMMLFKEALRTAVAEGKHAVTWTTGEQQARRYNLANHYSRLSLYTWHNTTKVNLRAFRADNPNGYLDFDTTLADLPNLVGQEVAEKLLARPSESKNGGPGGHAALRTLDLTDGTVSLGGKGMKAFYDGELRNEISRFVKRYGAKVEPIKLAGPVIVREDLPTLEYRTATTVGANGEDVRVKRYVVAWREDGNLRTRHFIPVESDNAFEFWKLKFERATGRTLGMSVMQTHGDTPVYWISGVPDARYAYAPLARVALAKHAVDEATTRNRFEHEVHGVVITPALRESVREGLPMFRRKDRPEDEPAAVRGDPLPKRVGEVASKIGGRVIGNEFVMSFRRLFVPRSLSEDAHTAQVITRESLGELAHASSEAITRLDGFSRAFDTMNRADSLAFIDAMERGAAQPNPALQPSADAIRELLDTWRGHVQDLGIGALDNFIENYFPHIWRDPSGAASVIRRIFGHRPLRGPASFLKKRSIPTTLEGIDAGLEPVSTNPLILTIAKVREMQRFVVGTKLFQRLHGEGIAQFVRAGRREPDGYRPIDDAVARIRYWSDEEQGFVERGHYSMPEDAARVINNHLSSSALENFLPATLFRNASNAMTALQLGFSAFHLGFTTLDAIVSKNALGIERMFHGEPLLAAKAFLEGATGPGAAAANLVRGHRLLQAYSDIGGATPLMRRIVEGLIAAGGTAKMSRDYQAAQGISPFTGVGAMSLARDIHAALTQPSDKVRALGQAIGGFPQEYATRLWRDLERMAHELDLPALQMPLEIAGRAVRASTSIIMEHIVPLQKLGVFADLAADHIRRNPDEDPVSFADAMQRIWNSVDNRLGELVYNNVFWNRTFKMVNMMLVRAVGWNFGTVSELGGAPVDTVRLLTYIAKGAPPRYVTQDGLEETGEAHRAYQDAKGKANRIADAAGHKIAYSLGLIATHMILGAILTYLMTGDGPKEPKDYFFWRTGRTNKFGKPQRGTLPTYVKDVYEVWQSPLQTAINKANPMFGAMYHLYTNRDFFGNAVMNPDASTWDRFLEGAEFAARQSRPFSFQGAKEYASGAAGPEPEFLKIAPWIGANPAPAYITAPNQMARYQRLQDEQAYLRGLERQMRLAREDKDQVTVDRLQQEIRQSKLKERATQTGIARAHLEGEKATRNNGTNSIAAPPIANLSQLHTLVKGKSRGDAASSLRAQGLPAFADLWSSLPDTPRPRVREALLTIASTA